MISPPEDILYLKQFVKKHPDNQMGWYLLGKHYLQAGKEGKANYCFIQAGDIYDAFEQESHPLAGHELEMLKEWDKEQKKKRLYRKVLLAAIPLLIIALFIPLNDYIRNKDKDAAQPIPVANQYEPAVGVLFVPNKEMRPLGLAMNRIVAAGDLAPKLVIAARLEEEGGWHKWNGNVRFIMEAEKQGFGDRLEVTMYDRDSCVCEPADTAGASRRFNEWSKQQEMHWTLSSAIQHYERLNGKWPQKLDDLIRPYPNNVLAGEGEQIRSSFDYVLSKVKLNRSGQSAADNDGSNELALSKEKAAQSRLIGTNGLFEQQWSKPLEIIIDTETHQLVVVQHNIIIRSYKVGLGGDRTPEGSFYISEKVRNPNGSDDGIFGSRGMTLSNTLYAIHGTNDPSSIGKDKSLGCIRMHNDDVEELYDLVPLGTVVQIKNGTLPPAGKPPADRFQLEPKQDETNPSKVYQWLT